MRRRTPGVVPASALLPARIAWAERHHAEDVIRLLEPLVRERRRERLLSVIGARLGSVRVVFDAPHDPHNGAAVLRSCEAFGVQELHVVERWEPFLVAASVSRGAEKWVDLQTWKEASPAVLALRESGHELVAAHPEGTLDPHELATIPKVALVLGNERDGISDELSAACTRRVRVPMRGFIESLNVSVTAAILLAHATWGRPGDLSHEDQRRLYARGLYFSLRHADDVLRDLPRGEEG